MKSLSPENLEKLFLFEVYVERLSIDYPKLCLTQNLLNNLKETVIRFQFLGFQPVEIREEEFIGKENDCGDREVNAGKSCLFSLRDLPKEVRCLEVEVKVMRNTVQNCCITLAVTSIKLGEQFADILKSCRLKKLSTSLKKPFTLYDKKCRQVGKIIVNINLSCFGKIITTSFQMDGEDSKAYVVQPGGEVPIADFLKSESSIDKGVCPEGFRSGSATTSANPAFAGGLLGGFGPTPAIPPIQGFPGNYASHYPGSYPVNFQGNNASGYTGNFISHNPSGYPSNFPGNIPGGYQGSWPGNNPSSFPSNYPGQGPFPGGLLGGTPHHSSPQPPQKEPIDSSSSDDEPPPAFQVCNCDYPLPPGFVPPGLNKKKKRKKKDSSCPLGAVKDFCLNPSCPKGYPQLPVVEEKHQVCQAMEIPAGVIGMKGEQMVFQLPQDNQPMPGNKRARFSLGGGYDNNNLKDVRIMNDGETKKFTVPNKSNDIYVIKVGKTNQETDQRQKMVLEVKQPRPPTDDRTFDDIRTQYLETDFMPEQPKKDKGKGKKGKKGKGKKGKKK